MIIAINLTSKTGESKQLLSRYFLLLAQQLPAHQFVFITNQQQSLQQQEGVSFIQSGPAKKNSLAWKFWYDYTLPSLVKKAGASIIIHADDTISLRSKTKQVMFIKDVSFLYGDDGEVKKDGRSFSKNLSAYFTKANAVWLHTEFTKNAIASLIKNMEEKLVVLGPIANPSIKPIDWQEKENIKEKYTAGKEYFIADAEIKEAEALRNLLKAFSLFKKRQKSNMQLVICVATSSKEHAKFITDLETYKYRDEINLIKDADEESLSKITAAAYACVSTVIKNELPLHCLQALQAEVPLLIANTHINIEHFSDAALYIQPDNISSIAAKMMHVFKDETARAEQIEKGKKITTAADDAISSIQHLLETIGAG